MFDPTKRYSTGAMPQHSTPERQYKRLRASTPSLLSSGRAQNFRGARASLTGRIFPAGAVKPAHPAIKRRKIAPPGMVLLPRGRRNTPSAARAPCACFLIRRPPTKGATRFFVMGRSSSGPFPHRGPAVGAPPLSKLPPLFEKYWPRLQDRPFRGGGFCSEFFERSLPAQSPAATQRPPRGRKPVKERNAPRGRSFIQKMDPAQNRTPLRRGQRAALHFVAGAAHFLRCMGSLQAVTPGSPFRRRVGD